MPTKTPTLREQNSQLIETIGLMTERLGELELMLDDVDWIRLSIEGDREFSNAGLMKIVTLARLAYLKNPLINRAVNLQALYVWGQGVEIGARPSVVDEVVQSFQEHPKNQVELTSHQARVMKEISLQIGSNLFFVLFTNVATGRTLIRSIPVDEILAGDIITNPQDRKEPWYYKRVWTQRSLNLETGEQTPERLEAYYPDWRYKPEGGDKVDTIGGKPVHWDQPVYHVKVGGLDEMRFGVPEVYSALDWASAVRQDLERYATLRAALARFAWALTTKGGTAGVAAAKAKFGSTLGNPGTGIESNPPPIAGSMFIGTDPNQLQPIRTAGMAPSPDDGRRLGLMVSAGTGIPETMLFGDSDVGNLATSKTLDRPTELKMIDRQTLWADVMHDILDYVCIQSAKAPSGALQGVATVDVDDEGVETLTVSETREATGKEITYGIDIDFPPILERDIKDRIAAIVSAATLDGKHPVGTLDKRTVVSLIASALGLDDIDELIDLVAPEDGKPDAEGNEPGTGWVVKPPAPVIAPGKPGEAPKTADEEVAEALREVRAAAVALVESIGPTYLPPRRLRTSGEAA